MTNEEIIDHVSTKGNIVFYGAHTAEMYELLELARADEREKIKAEFSIIADKIEDEAKDFVEQYILQQPQGVEVWVSRDDYENSSAIFSSHKPHEEVLGGVLYYNSGLYGFEDALGLQQGECAKFRIVRVNHET